MYFGALVLVPRLMEFVYKTGTGGAVGRQVQRVHPASSQPGPPAANTQGATPQKDKGKA
jgi:hypothetical protein